MFTIVLALVVGIVATTAAGLWLRHSSRRLAAEHAAELATAKEQHTEQHARVLADRLAAEREYHPARRSLSFDEHTDQALALGRPTGHGSGCQCEFCTSNGERATSKLTGPQMLAIARMEFELAADGGIVAALRDHGGER